MFKSDSPIHPPKVGFAQASGVAGYVLLFALAVSNLQRLEHEPPQIVAMAMFLTAFILSALVCGSLVLAYPATLALKGKIKDALEIIAWTAVSLIGFLLVFAAVLLAVR